MRPGFIKIAVLVLALHQGVQAGPLILASNIQNGNCGVTVTVNSLTFSFYGASLQYNFYPANGGAPAVFVQSIDSLTNPVSFALAGGGYTLYITSPPGPVADPLNPAQSGKSSSPDYPVNVASCRLCNTGRSNNNAGLCGPVLPVGTLDPHWQLAAPFPTTSSADSLVDPTNPPLTFGPVYANTAVPNAWLPNNFLSEWITPSAASLHSELGGQYVYRTTFEGFFNSVAGRYSSDNELFAVYLNGVLVPLFPLNGPTDFGNWTNFNLSTAFNNPPAVNTFDFVVRNRGGGGIDSNPTPTGLRVEFQPHMAVTVNRPNVTFVAGILGPVTLLTSPQTVFVDVPPGTPWTATSNTNFIILTPPSGTGPKNLMVSIDATRLPTTSGTVVGTITITSAAAGNPTTTLTVGLTVSPAANFGPPFGSFDTPVNLGPAVSGAIPVTGWALDKIEVTKVDIWREPVQGEPTPAGGLFPIGNAVFVENARADVEAQYPSLPFNYRAGWGYQMLTNFLPQGNGTFKIHAIAHNQAGAAVDLGTKTITVDNAHASKPFGTIDTPTQSGTISGSDSVNFGWALTPQPGIIPNDGSTITVVIDGVPAGHPTYNQFRSDIATLFPGYANSAGAVGFFHINPTSLANGIHTISWNVFDNLGRGEGLGSRYFNVANTGGSVAAPEDPIDESIGREGVRVRHGLNVQRQSDLIAPDADGAYPVTMEEMGHIELDLGAANGKMLIDGDVRQLPIGSALKGGVFYWQPGPGFLGDYRMQFDRPDGTKILVQVKIVPKRHSIDSAGGQSR